MLTVSSLVFIFMFIYLICPRCGGAVIRLLLHSFTSRRAHLLGCGTLHLGQSPPQCGLQVDTVPGTSFCNGRMNHYQQSSYNQSKTYWLNYPQLIFNSRWHVLVNFTWGSTILYCSQSLGCVRQIPSISTGPSGNQRVGRQSYQVPCSSGNWYRSLEYRRITTISWMPYYDITCGHGHLPWLLSTLSRRPMLCRCLGVDTDRARTSPMASWKPGLAPSLKDMGWSLYCRKYCTWPISWWTVIRSSMVTTVHCLILETQARSNEPKIMTFPWTGNLINNNNRVWQLKI